MGILAEMTLAWFRDRHGVRYYYGSGSHHLLAFALTVSKKKTETTCMPPPRTRRTMMLVEAAGQTYKQVHSFTFLGGAMTEISDMCAEIAR
ncbi:unnamed protein product [Ascophyllum nodosum]